MKTSAQAAPAPLAGGTVVGSVRLVPIDSIKPNDWNPNAMSKETYASLKHGLENDGWLASQALLVWGSDDIGDEQNIIIDGEHRWRVAKDIGIKNVPVVALSGVPAAKVKSLTVAMNQRRGTFDEEKLKDLIASIQFDVPDLALSTGLGDDEIAKMVAQAEVSDLNLLPEVTAGLPNASIGNGKLERDENGAPATSGIRMVQLFLDGQTIEEFNALCRKMAAEYGTQTTTDTVLETLRRAAATPV